MRIKNIAILATVGLGQAVFPLLAVATRGFAYSPRLCRLGMLTGEQQIVVGGFAAIGVATILLAAWELHLRSR